PAPARRPGCDGGDGTATPFAGSPWVRGRLRHTRADGPACVHEHPGTPKVRRRMAGAAARAHGDTARPAVPLHGGPLAPPRAPPLAALLEARRRAQRRVAGEIDGEIVPRSRHGERVLAPGDKVEIVHALGGG